MTNPVDLMNPAYDAVIVGGRCAGAATALLLARAGLDVLVVEQATAELVGAESEALNDELGSTGVVPVPGDTRAPVLLGNAALIALVLYALLPLVRSVVADPAVASGASSRAKRSGASSLMKLM